MPKPEAFSRVLIDQELRESGWDLLDERRARKTVAGAWTDFLYDLSGNVLTEIDSSCAPTCVARDYFSLNGMRVGEFRSGLTYFVHTDHLGSTRLVTGLNQAVVQNLDYLPFGEITSTDSHISTHEFTGDERDAETSLDHTQFRQYTSQLARWLSPDPAGLAAVNPMNPQSWNRYSYVDDDPMDFVDPLGLILCGSIWDGCIPLLGPPNPGGGGDRGTGLGGGGADDPGKLIFMGGSKGGNSSGKIVERLNGQNCTPSVFDPSCKPPSCPAVFAKSTVNAMDALNLPVLPPGQGPEDAAKAAAAAAAAQHVIDRGLVVPLRSSIVRNIFALGDVAATAIVWVPVIYSELVGLKAEVQALRSGTCTTIWNQQ
jgi:RHS repeat-associated protein